MILFLVFVVAMSVTMVLIPPLLRVAGRLHFLDQPSARKVHSRPVPRIGGLAMVVGTLLPLAVVLNPTSTVIAFMVGAVILLVFGTWDDRRDLDYRLKFLGQLLAIAVVVFAGDVRIESVTLDARESLPEWIALPLTILFLLGITNAINLSDGLDGLAGGTTLLCFCAIGLVAYASGDLMVCSVAVAVIGGLLGFLRYNTHPARVFMGDGGSQFLGFSVGVLAVLATQNPETAASAALPVLLLGLPILDTLMVMTQRIAERRSPFSADRNHLHHKLLALGFDHHEAVIVIYLLQFALFLLAYFLRFESDLLILSLFGLFALAVIYTLYRSQVTGWRLQRALQPGSSTPLAEHIRWLRQPNRLPQWALIFIACVVPAYALYVIMRASPVSVDLAWLALALAVFAALALPWFGESEASWFGKGVMYTSAVLIVYLDQTSMAMHLPWEMVTFGLLAAAVVIRFRLSHDRRFEVTPLDVLVIFIALVVPNLPTSFNLPAGLPAGIAKITVLLYAIEMIMAARLRWLLPQAAVAAILAFVAVRGLFPV